MSNLQAFIYDGQSSARRAVVLKFTVPGYLLLQELGTLSRYRLDDVEVSPQLGAQPARVDLPDGSHLEVPDSAAFYAQLANMGGRRQWIHGLESRWSWVLAAVLFTVLCGWLAYDRGIPALAREIAFALPEEIDERIGAEGLEALDSYALLPSELDIARQYELMLVFTDVIAAVGVPEENTYRLEFRRGGQFGANALALPAGTVVVTDELIALADHDDEIAAVMAHEIGHVRNRHALRALLQNSAVAGAVIWFTGDVSAATSMAAGIPTLLAQAGYSREFEYEADDVALEYLQKADIPRHRFADLLLRLDAQDTAASGLTDLLATHPDTQDRITAFQ